MGKLFEFIGKLILSYTPPEDPTMSPASAAWRWKTFYGVVGLYIIIILLVMLLFGGLASLGFGGVAWAGDIVAVQQQLAALQRNAAQDALVADQLKICRLSSAVFQPGAPKDLLQSALTSAQAEFQRHLNEYAQVNGGRPYATQPCSVILIAGGK